MARAITLLSGGLDSFISTAIARKKHKIVLALTFDYGQRASCREILAAGKMCRMWHIPHKIIKLPWLGEITNTALVNRKVNLPTICHSRGSGNLVRSRDPRVRGDDTFSKVSARSVWVPNRNALFINIAAAFAETLHAQLIVTGFNKEEGATFPDNSAHFVSAINRSLKYSTLEYPSPLWKRGVRGDLKHPNVVSFTQKMTKRDMVRYALRHKLSLNLCWPCYEGGKKLCGRCESCVRFFHACPF